MQLRFDFTHLAAASSVVALSVALGGCGSVASTSTPPSPEISATPSSELSTPSRPSPSTDAASPTSPSEKALVTPIPGTTVRFESSTGSIDVTITEDNPATRDLLAMLPLTLEFDDFAGREKIAYPPRALRFAGSPPSSAGAGDLAIYTPWGNIAFFYDGERGAPSPQIVRLGTFDATRTELDVLDQGPVTVQIV
jgi:hypothetical protein